MNTRLAAAANAADPSEACPSGGVSALEHEREILAVAVLVESAAVKALPVRLPPRHGGAGNRVGSAVEDQLWIDVQSEIDAGDDPQIIDDRQVVQVWKQIGRPGASAEAIRRPGEELRVAIGPPGRELVV